MLSSFHFKLQVTDELAQDKNWNRSFAPKTVSDQVWINFWIARSRISELMTLPRIRRSSVSNVDPTLHQRLHRFIATWLEANFIGEAVVVTE